MPYQGEVTTVVNIGAIPFKVTQVDNAEIADRTLNFTHIFTKEHDEVMKTLELRRESPAKNGTWQTRPLKFLGIAADKYDFKDNCGKTKNGLTATIKGIALRLKGGSLALVANELQPLSGISSVSLKCDALMFSKPDEEVTAIVTYGVGPWKNDEPPQKKHD